MPRLTPLTYERLSAVWAEYEAAGYGQKAAVFERHASFFECTPGALWKRLSAAGFKPPTRKQRSDARSSVVSDAELERIAAVLQASLNKKGQRMPVRTALDMLRASGQLTADVHESTISRQLYARRLHPEQMALPEPHQVMRSLHPNHVAQSDSTTGAYYYLPGGRLRWMPEDQFYKNKVANIVKASTDLLTRYAYADHFSHSLKFRYYLGGETAENLLDFLTWSMWKQDSSPMHGVPVILLMDPGAANKGHLVRNFCERVGIQLLHHAPGAARVTGSVEKAHDLARMHFETRFRFRDPADVTLDKLNADIEQWAASYCATAKHGRHQQTRFGSWMSITADQLRVAASVEALREAARTEPVERRVGNDKRISFGSPSRQYLLALVPGVAAGLKVTVVSNPFRAPAIDVRFTCPDTGEETWHVVEPEETGAGGFPVDAPVWGEQMRRAGFSDVDRNRNAMTRAAYKSGDELPTVEEADRARKAHAAAFAGVVDSMADVKATQVPSYLPRRTTPLVLPARRVEVKRLSVVQACKWLMEKLGARYTPQMFAYVSERYSDPANPGVPEDHLEALATELGATQEESALRAVQGIK